MLAYLLPRQPPNATGCSNDRQISPTTFPLTDSIHILCKVCPALLFWLATEWSHHHRLDLNSATPIQQDKKAMPNPPPSLNKCRGPNAVQPPSQVPFESTYPPILFIFPSLISFPHISCVFCLSDWSLGLCKVSRCPYQCTIHGFCYPLQGTSYHGTLSCQSCMSLTRSSLPTHRNSQSRPYSMSSGIPSVCCHKQPLPPLSQVLFAYKWDDSLFLCSRSCIVQILHISHLGLQMSILR